MQRKWFEDLNSWGGFTYLRLKGVPMKRSTSGGVIAIDEAKLETLVAKAILQSPVPIRGKELALLRKVSGLSLSKFGRRLDVSSSTIFYWEKATKQKLNSMSSVAIRLLCAELLGIDLEQGFSRLIGFDNFDSVEVMVTGKKPNKKRYKTKTVFKPSYRGDRKVKVRVEV